MLGWDDAPIAGAQDPHGWGVQTFSAATDSKPAHPRTIVLAVRALPGSSRVDARDHDVGGSS